MALTTLWRRVTRRAGTRSSALPRTVDVLQALDLMAEGAQLLDVRTDDEWRTGHAQTAVHVPLDRLEARAGNLELDLPVVVMCQSGARADRAARELRELGFDATCLRGGIGSWRRAGGLLVRGV